jgi:hypothetical protein
LIGNIHTRGLNLGDLEIADPHFTQIGHQGLENI